MNLQLFAVAHAVRTETSAVQSTTQVTEEHASGGGISLDPAIVGFNIFNVVVLLLILKWILYKPLMNLLKQREHQIKKGVEDAENAKVLLQESEVSREKILKEARAEGQNMIETARKTGEQVRTDLLTKAQEDAQQIINSGQQLIESERNKALLEIQTQAVDLVVKAAEKLIKSKLDIAKDSQLIKESIESYAQ